MLCYAPEMEVKMKIGTCVSLDSMDGIEGKLKSLQENHFDSCQLLAWNPSVWTEENAARLTELLERYGICVSAFWCGWEGPKVWDFYDGQLTLGLVPPEYRQMRVKNLCDGADFARLMGIQDVVTHMGFIPVNLHGKLKFVFVTNLLNVHVMARMFE